jgi:hypothetical protein
MSEREPEAEISEDDFSAIGVGPDDNPEDFTAGDDGGGEPGFGRSTPGDDTEETGSDSVFDRLLSTEPDTPLGEVDPLFDTDRGGFARLSRGVSKATPGDGSGVPAVVDLVVGAVEVWANAQTGDSGDGSDDDDGLNVGGV